jgi:hypothetical protein
MSLLEQVPLDAVREAAPEGNRIVDSVCPDPGGIDLRGYLEGRAGSRDPSQAQPIVSVFLGVAIAESHAYLD